MIKGIIFDMDGTITLTEPLHHQAYSAIFKNYGIEFTYDEEVKKFAGAGSNAIFSTVLKEHGKAVSSEEIEQCIKKKKELYTKIVQEAKIPMVPGADNFVRDVHEHGLKIIIATGNSNLDAVRFMLKKVGLLSYFPDMVSVAEVGRGKPFPDIFLEAAKRMGFLPSECVVFEDAINGVVAAKAAGIRCVALETTTPREDLIAAGASMVIKDYSKISFSILNNSFYA